jgi:hypothetical protein
MSLLEVGSGRNLKQRDVAWRFQGAITGMIDCYITHHDAVQLLLYGMVDCNNLKKSIMNLYIRPPAPCQCCVPSHQEKIEFTYYSLFVLKMV